MSAKMLTFRAKVAALSNIRSAFAFPVLAGSEVAAVLEFFAEKLTLPDEALLNLMEGVGTQLGRVFERKYAEDQLIHDAFHDHLTGLPNRAFFLERLRGALARTHRRGEEFLAVLFIDLDRFKVVNDSLGHHVGDQLIQLVAERLCPSSVIGSSPAGQTLQSGSYTLARLGGDEFAALIEDISDVNEAVLAAVRIQEELALPFSVNGQEIHIGASIGVACSGGSYAVSDEIVRDADLAMYRAKSLGKARIEVFDREMYTVAVNRLAIENSLRRAIHDEDFVLHYQPIMDLVTGLIIGFEALVRWNRKDSGLVYPDQFISIAEDTGLIVEIGSWAFKQACRTMRRWQKEFPCERPLTISVNLSARQFAQANLVQQTSDVLLETGIDPATVTFEITESVAMGDVQRSIRMLEQLRCLGLRFSIDDFGTGFSSFSYLHRFPLQTLKIDRSFVKRMEADGDSRSIVQTIIALARNLRMKVVAEGAETMASVSYLKNMQCDFAQGFFFSRPVDEAAASRMLQQQAESQKLAIRLAAFTSDQVQHSVYSG